MPSLFQTILSQVKDRFSVQENDLESIATCITTLTTVPVTASQLSIKKGTLMINVAPTLKHAILSKKEAVLAHCKDNLIGVYAIA